MIDYLRTALLIEERASKLPGDCIQRAHLLAVAKAARHLGIELASPLFQYELGKGYHRKRSMVWSRAALKTAPGAKRSDLERKGERAAICHVIEREGNDESFDDYANRVANYCFPID